MLDLFGTEVIINNTNYSNCLVGEPYTNDIISNSNKIGYKVGYTVALPKIYTEITNDNFINAQVVLQPPFEGIYRVIGEPTAGIEENIPLQWNKKLKIEKDIYILSDNITLVYDNNERGIYGEYIANEEQEEVNCCIRNINENRETTGSQNQLFTEIDIIVAEIADTPTKVVYNDNTYIVNKVQKIDNYINIVAKEGVFKWLLAIMILKI